MSTQPVPITRSLDRISALQENVERVIRGKSEVIQFCIAALLAKGHILLEDVPGVGKTTLAHALARSLSLAFQRIQFTSDLLPADIVGVTIYNQDLQEFEFVSGPVFTNVLLADEINRATPKSQSALLEAMSEGMITIEKRRMALPDPFLVIATQNPIEHVGTYPLPESQLDRFLMKLTIGYPSANDEKQLLRSGGGQEALEHLEAVLDGDEVRELQARVHDVHVSEALVEYLMLIVQTTRTHARSGPRRLDARRADVLQGLPGAGDGLRPRLRDPRGCEAAGRAGAVASHRDERPPRQPRRLLAGSAVHPADGQRDRGPEVARATL